MMKIGFLAAAAVLMSAAALPPVAAPARTEVKQSRLGPVEQCLIGAGCVNYDNIWYCPNPDAYSLCAPE